MCSEERVGLKKQLHVISTGKQSKETLIEIIDWIHPSIDFIHLREKSWSARKLAAVVQQLVATGVPANKIIINDRVDVAHMMNCGGVQLAHHSMNVSEVKKSFPHLRVGCSVHSVKEAINKQKQKADYLLYGHIFSTLSKRGLAPRGIGNLQKIVKATHIPVIAIGGITPERTPSVIQAGASGVAVLSGILLADDPLEAVKRYRNKLDAKG